MDELNDISECALTTVDNPYDPFNQFDDWFIFDTEKGYNSCSKIDRMTNITDDMSEAEISKEIERAIDTIIEYDFLNIYKKVKNNT